ncbi:hypothetical protein RUM44_004242 [Polyplax serrata]|uniref:Fatty acyl-CoA reductase n=1 Tax=Polyplax serrata TaxID=468196 RepID=A0ABR1B2A6_POLSC
MEQTSPDGDKMTTSKSQIQRFFAGKSIFITGSTGFLGSVLLEKLLRCCPDIKRVYLLIREKKGVDIQQRFKTLVNTKLFCRLQPEFVREKLVFLNGDMTLPGLGLTESDRNTLKNEVSVVFHSAATTNFGAHLRKAVAINLQGTEKVLQLAHEMKNLQAFVYISTAYCNAVVRGIITEDIYPSWLDSDELVEKMDKMTDAEISEETERLLGGYPTTYSFTKHMCENLVYKKRKSIPVAVVRPSVSFRAANQLDRSSRGFLYVPPVMITQVSGVGRKEPTKLNVKVNLFLSDGLRFDGHGHTSVFMCSTTTGLTGRFFQQSFDLDGRTLEEPIPGWVENVQNGGVAFIAGAGKGIFRTVLGDNNKITDFVPCDMVASLSVATAWDVAKQGKGSFKVYHCTSGVENPITLNDYCNLTIEKVRQFPCSEVLWYPGAKCRINTMRNFIFVFLFHLLPGYLIAGWEKLNSKNRPVISYHKKFIRGMKFLYYFTIRSWHFDTKNTRKLQSDLCEEDKILFNFDVTRINWPKYLEKCVLGVRHFYHGDYPETIEKSRNLIKLLRIVHYGLYFGLFLFVFYFLHICGVQFWTALAGAASAFSLIAWL